MTIEATSAPSDAATRVSELLLDTVLDQPVQSLLMPELHARLLVAMLRGQLQGPVAWPSTALGAAVRWLQPQPTLGAVIPPAVIELVRGLLHKPYLPDRALVLGLLSQKPLRSLARELMVGTLLDYGRKLRPGAAEPVAGPQGKGGLLGLGRLAGEAMRRGSAAAMAIAPGVTSAVSDEFERQMQRRATEFADGAVEELLGRTASTFADPQRLPEQLAMKLAALDYVLTLRGSQLAGELQKLDLPGVAELVRLAALRWLLRDTAEQELAVILQAVRAHAPVQSLRELLAAVGALAPVRAALLALFAQAAGPAIGSGALSRALAEPTLT